MIYNKLDVINIHDIYKQLSKDKLIVLIIFFICITISIIYSYLSSPYFRSESRIKIELKKKPPILNKIEDGFYNIQKINSDPHINILKSKKVIGLAINRVNNELVVGKKLDDSINKVRQNLTIKEPSKESGVLMLQLDWDNFLLSEKLLNAIVSEYILYNRELQNEQDYNNLISIDEQLPIIKNNLDFFEGKIAKYYDLNKLTEYDTELKLLSRSISEIELKLISIKEQKIENSFLYKDSHPRIQTLLEVENNLITEKEKLMAQINSLPIYQNEFIKLNREADSWRYIYTTLLQRKQEINISRNSTDTNIYVIDSAYTFPKPIKPKKEIVILLGIIVSCLLSSAFIALRLIFNNTIMSSAQVKVLGINLFYELKNNKNNVPITIDSLINLNIKVFHEVTKNDIHIMSIRGIGQNDNLNFIYEQICQSSLKIFGKVLYMVTSFEPDEIMISSTEKPSLYISEYLSSDNKQQYLTNYFESLANEVFVITGGKLKNKNDILKVNVAINELIEFSKQYVNFIILIREPLNSQLSFYINYNKPIINFYFIHETIDTVTEVEEYFINEAIKDENDKFILIKS